MDLVFLPEPDEPTRRAVTAALARLSAAAGPFDRAYSSPWRLAGLAEGVQHGASDDEEYAPRVYGWSPRSMRGVTRA